MFKYFLLPLTLIIALTSCEEVIEIDLNSANPAFVVEATISKDSVCLVRLTRTTSYFSSEEAGIIDNAEISLSDGTTSEELVYTGNGYYKGGILTGTEGKSYEIAINHEGKTYKGISKMPIKSEIVSVRFYRSESISTLNPLGKTVFTFECEFTDIPGEISFYMIRIISQGKLLESYFLLDENNLIDGVIYNTGTNTITYWESIFYEGGEVNVQVLSINEPIYKYFTQLNDVLFWKRRIMPPTPYNPASNISNGALGYFSAWTIDSDTFILE